MSTYGYPDWSPARDYLSGLSGSQVAVAFSQVVQANSSIYNIPAGKTFVLNSMHSCLTAGTSGVVFPATFSLLVSVNKGFSGAAGIFHLISTMIWLPAIGVQTVVEDITGPMAISGGAAGNDIMYQGSQSNMTGWFGQLLIRGVLLN